MCWTHGLYDAMIYVYNRGLQDFTTPLKELLNLLADACKRPREELGNAVQHLLENEQKLGYKLLL